MKSRFFLFLFSITSNHFLSFYFLFPKQRQQNFSRKRKKKIRRNCFHRIKLKIANLGLSKPGHGLEGSQSLHEILSIPGPTRWSLRDRPQWRRRNPDSPVEAPTGTWFRSIPTVPHANSHQNHLKLKSSAKAKNKQERNRIHCIYLLGFEEKMNLASAGLSLGEWESFSMTLWSRFSGSPAAMLMMLVLGVRWVGTSRWGREGGSVHLLLWYGPGIIGC